MALMAQTLKQKTKLLKPSTLAENVLVRNEGVLKAVPVIPQMPFPLRLQLMLLRFSVPSFRKAKHQPFAQTPTLDVRAVSQTLSQGLVSESGC